MAGESKKSRKHGRNAKWCEAYKKEGRREKNKARRLLRHLRRYGPRDRCAVHCYNNLPILARPAGFREINAQTEDRVTTLNLGELYARRVPH